MVIKYKLNLHSIIDVITNSSTEIFCRVKANNKSEIKDILTSILKEIGCENMEFSVSQREEMDENDECYCVEDEYEISYDYAYSPCTFIKEKIEELLEVVD